MYVVECQTTCPLDNWLQTTRPWSLDSVMDKRMKNNLYDVKSWVHIFSGSLDSVVGGINERGTSCLKIGDKLSGANCPGGELSEYLNFDTWNHTKLLTLWFVWFLHIYQICHTSLLLLSCRANSWNKPLNIKEIENIFHGSIKFLIYEWKFGTTRKT